MNFKIYFKSRATGKVEERIATRIDDREAVLWLKDGGWIRLSDAYLTRDRAEWHEFEHVSRTVPMKPENEK